MTTGPLAGPASAYPTFRAPASICFREANEVFVPGLIAGSLVSPGWAPAEPTMLNWAAAMVTAAAPKRRRREWSICSDALVVSMMSLLDSRIGREGATMAPGYELIKRGILNGVRVSSDSE